MKLQLQILKHGNCIGSAYIEIQRVIKIDCVWDKLWRTARFWNHMDSSVSCSNIRNSFGNDSQQTKPLFRISVINWNCENKRLRCSKSFTCKLEMWECFRNSELPTRLVATVDCFRELCRNESVLIEETFTHGMSSCFKDKVECIKQWFNKENIVILIHWESCLRFTWIQFVGCGWVHHEHFYLLGSLFPTGKCRWQN